MILSHTAGRSAIPASCLGSPEFTPVERTRLEELRRAVRTGRRNDYGAGWQEILFLRWLYRHCPNLRG